MVVATETNNWILAHETYAQAERQASAQLQAHLGNITLKNVAEIELVNKAANESTLLAAAQMGALGDAEAIAVVKVNAGTDVAERLYKVAHQTKVFLKFEAGHLAQKGRKLVDLNRNALEYTVLIPEMRKRSEQELKNTLMFEALYANGSLVDHDAFVFSTTSSRMTAEQKKAYGLFADTETCSIQSLSVDGDIATLETAFVAGKATPNSQRHDIMAVQKLVSEHGIQLTSDDGSDMLQYIVLVPKTESPNGVVDMVQRYDEASGGTFYGRALPKQDYLAYARTCELRNDGFKDTVNNITQQLLAEAHLFKTPLDAILRLDELSERFCVLYAADDSNGADINTLVFGETAAAHLGQYRYFMEHGDSEQAQDALNKAQATAVSSSCPLVKPGTPDAEGEDNNSSEDSSGKKMMNCPFCKARVFDDPCAKFLSCTDCKAWVLNGSVGSKGDGGHKARAERRKQRKSRSGQKSGQYALAA